MGIMVLIYLTMFAGTALGTLVMPIYLAYRLCRLR